MTLKEVLFSNSIVLMDFQSEDCPPCKLIRIELEKLSAELGKELGIFLIDQKEKEDVFKAFNVRSLPHLKLFKDGRPVWSYTGLIAKEDIIEEINKFK